MAAVARVRVPAAPARGRARDKKCVTAAAESATSPRADRKAASLHSGGSGKAEGTPKGHCQPSCNEATECKERNKEMHNGLGSSPQVGSKSARGLLPGPSVLRKWPGTNRHGGTAGVSFAPRAE